MSSKQGIVQAGQRLTTGTQVFTDSVGNFSSDIKAALNLSCGATALDTSAARGAVNFGFTDLVSSLSMASVVENGSATPGVRSWVSNTGFVDQVQTTGSLRSEGAYSANGSNTLTVNWPTTISGVAELQNIILLGGSGTEYACSTALFTGAPNNDQTFAHGLTGTPDFIIVIGIRQTAFGSLQSGYLYSIGFWTAAGSVGFGIGMTAATAPTTVGAIMRTGFVGNFVGGAGPVVNNTISVSGVGATNMTVSTGGGGNNAALMFFAGRGTVNPFTVKAGLQTTPTSVTSQSITGMSAQPSNVLRVSTRLTGNTLDTTDAAGAWGIAYACNNNGTIQQAAVGMNTSDNVNPSQSNSIMSAKSCLVIDTSGAKDVEATLSSFNSDGFTDAYSNVAASALQTMYLAWGDGPAAVAGTGRGLLMGVG